MKAIFLDRDGTLNVGIPKYERVDSIDKVELLPHVIEGLSLLATLDYGVFIVTNQLGLAEGRITREEFDAINARTIELITASGIKILETYVCPHGKESTCECKKPKPGMLLDAAKKYSIDLKKSWMVGDRITDVETGINAGTKNSTGSIWRSGRFS
jgi:D-glycero-D-manno-heptose 1,7-bisphosphate phosphatase